MQEHQVSRARVMALVGVLGAAYMLSQFLRSSNAVIAPNLMAELGLGPEAIGLLGGAFFLAFALAQIPVGLMIDGWGPRLTIFALFGFAIAGSVLFFAGHDVRVLIVARGLMGLGCAPILMGSFIVYARWFAPERFATMAGLVMAVGYSGAILSTGPLGWTAQAVGWRIIFAGVAVLSAIVAAGVLIIVRDAPPGHPFHSRHREAPSQALRGLGAVLHNPSFGRILPLQSVGSGAVASILGLWGGPFLSDVFGLDTAERGSILLIMAIASVAGLVAYGPLDRLFNTRKRLVIAGALANLTILTVLALDSAPVLWRTTALLAALGFFNGYVVIIYAHARAIFPDRLVGRGLTLGNMGNMGGTALIQALTGLVMGLFTHAASPLIGYRAVFGLLALILCSALFVYLGVKDEKPRGNI